MGATRMRAEQLDGIGLPDGPPGMRGLARELATGFAPLRLAVRWPTLLGMPRGDGRVVLDLPGWKAPEGSMLPVRGYLRALGWDARAWGLGTNHGNVGKRRDRMLDVVSEAVAVSGRPVSLVGWSLGGVVAREVAREAPHLVHRIVTYGSPILGGPTHTIGAGSAGEAESRRVALLQEELDATRPITTPMTAIYSRRDGIVDWRCCIDRTSTNVTMVEVGATHIGLGIDADVWRTVARALAA